MRGKMMCLIRSTFLVFWCCLAVSGALTITCSAEEAGLFSGSWSATGTRDLLAFGEERQVSLLKLQGHVNLRDPIGNVQDCWSECIGLSDTQTGSNVRCVWTCTDDQKVYVVLKATNIEQGAVVTGEIVGGTNKAAGITGTLEFTWSTMFIQRSGNTESVGGYTKELKGSYVLP